ncbi:hypothetical protein G7Z17_g12681 [Cylindrodendrum hubeiense]|uniref:2-amino-4-hydroxy-6-hydroxymethyldihydropteridine diphosphokinase n=1 Tax=Cylindrodendrum hubeiense TaxID=595255 RepID=A0A9P5L2W1_9HYPO|nr:hypothetical protein G7Z17_g12681 [Cylindrodendrum hubeiense]
MTRKPRNRGTPNSPSRAGSPSLPGPVYIASSYPYPASASFPPRVDGGSSSTPTPTCPDNDDEPPPHALAMLLRAHHSSLYRKFLRRSPIVTSEPHPPSLGASAPGRNAGTGSLRPFPSRCASTSPASQPRRMLSAAAVRPRLHARSTVPGLKHSACGCACGTSKPRKKTAYIALGSNLGDRVAEIEHACNEMDRRGIKVKRTSSLWETEPMYVKDQDRFVNGACEVETELEPLALLDELQAIEREMGRKKVIDKGPRNIDLDILLYGNEKVSHERLTVPHAAVLEREFVLRPLAELMPAKSLDPSKPWKLIQDYLQELPRGEPMSSMTPMSATSSPLTALASNRKTHIMGILNVTPDSFSDGGVHAPENLSQTILDMVRNGTSIIDVGGQSTAPGREQVSAEEEAARVVPAVQLIRSLPEARGVVISVDTYRASVAEQVVASGADIINDVSAGLLDPDMLPTVAP